LIHTLKNGRPTVEYETHKDLFDFLNLEKDLEMHWTNMFGWDMVQHMHEIILKPRDFMLEWLNICHLLVMKLV
jgi:hypothetical protein